MNANNFNFFADCTNLKNLRIEYIKLCKQFHPDIICTKYTTKERTEIMQIINVQYEKLYKKLEQTFTDNCTNDSTKSEYDYNKDSELNEVIQKIVHFDLELEIIGFWLWIKGNTYPYKDLLKSLGCNFSSNKKCWFFVQKDFNKDHKYKYKSNFEDLRLKYGSIQINNIKQVKLN